MKAITDSWLDEHAGRWFVRTSHDGVGYNGYRRKRIGEWNDAPCWTGTPTCEECGGFFGIDPDHHQAGLMPRPTIELCEWRGARVPIDDDKICVSSYRVVAVGDAIPDGALERCGLQVLRRGTHTVGQRALYRGAESCSITVDDGGLLWTYGDSCPMVVVNARGQLQTLGDSRPAVAVNDGGQLQTLGDSRPAVAVNDGGQLQAYNDSRPTVVVNAGGRLWTNDDSCPMVVVNDGGRLWTDGDSCAAVIVNDGGSLYTYGESRPTVVVNDGGRLRTDGDSRPTVIVNAGGSLRTDGESRPTVVVNDGGLLQIHGGSRPTVHYAAAPE